MKDSQQRQIISSGRPTQGRASPSLSGKPPDAVNVSCNQAQVGRRSGSVVVTGTERRYTKPNWQGAVVPTQCELCQRGFWTVWGNLVKGTAGCAWCAKPRQLPPWLDRRLTAAKQRCTNPSDKNYPNYGGRGVEFRFDSVLAGGLWIMENVPNWGRDLTIDRIDTNGHYEEGNIRFITAKEQQANRRNSVLSYYDPQFWPYAPTVVKRKISKGMSRDQIIADAELAVREKRKNWRGIESRLASMTYSMPEYVTALPYRGGWPTTA